METTPRTGMDTPWGPAETVTPLGSDGAFQVQCLNHGGIFLPPHLLNQLPPSARADGRRRDGWFEEDFEAMIPIAFLADAIGIEHDLVRQVRQGIRISFQSFSKLLSPADIACWESAG
jgi:hypothetical protein